jgi:4-amino-4-deoxychorismate lyase|tara:strand:- start:368 stop:1219 length:852 start_codon:yes stop_codon:yes gene_type:complete
MIHSVVNGIAADSLPLTDRGGAYGHGLFETMLLHNGVLPLRQLHSERLLRDAPTLGLNIAAEPLGSNLDSLIGGLNTQQCQSGIVKLMVTAGSGGRGYASPAQTEAAPRIIVQYFPPPTNLQGQRQMGISVMECDYRLPLNPVLAGIKHLNRLDQVIACSEWAGQYDDGFMFSRDDSLIETTRANVFIKLSSGWVTPRLDQAGVCGVMRQLLLDRVFVGAGLNVRQALVSREQLSTASEIFTCSSVRGIVPVTSTKPVGTLPIGDDTRLLQSALQNNYDCFPC